MKLTTITIPASVTNIGGQAFLNCQNLSEVTILAQTPLTLGKNVFEDITGDFSIFVPKNSLDAYKTAYPDLADRIKPIMSGTGIQSVHSSESIVHSEADAWYTLDGRRIQGKPLQKGLYINNGNKIIIK